MKRQKSKTATMTMKVDPRIKAAAEIAAARDRRSLTSFVEILVLKHCKEVGIDLPIDKETS
jgi:hypothetical protein